MIGINRVVHGGDSTQRWSWGPSISLPLFEGGAGRARVETARARYDRALAQYHGQVLVAVQEVADALTRVDASGRRAHAAREWGRHFRAVSDTPENRTQLEYTSK